KASLPRLGGERGELMAPAGGSSPRALRVVGASAGSRRHLFVALKPSANFADATKEGTTAGCGRAHSAPGAPASTRAARAWEAEPALDEGTRRTRGGVRLSRAVIGPALRKSNCLSSADPPGLRAYLFPRKLGD